MSHRPSISFNKPTTIPLKPTQLVHNCQIPGIYITQLFKESFWPSFCNEKWGLHVRRTSADFRHINMQKKIHWLHNISQAARAFVSHTISSLYQTILTSKEARLCLSEEENLWMPSLIDVWHSNPLEQIYLCTHLLSSSLPGYLFGVPSKVLWDRRGSGTFCCCCCCFFFKDIEG